METELEHSDGVASFTVSFPVIIRPCRSEDLPTLEWFGLFRADRELIHKVFDEQQHGRSMILVADANRVASGQVWIDFSRLSSDAVGVIWALRVFPSLQNLGVGSRLVAAAEDILLSRGFGCVELTVDKENLNAMRFYERLGYLVTTDAREDYCYPSTDHRPVSVPDDHWLMRKRLVESCSLCKSPAHIARHHLGHTGATMTRADTVAPTETAQMAAQTAERGGTI